MPELVAEIEQIAAVIARQHPPLGIEVRNVGDVGAQPHFCAGIIRIDLERAKKAAKGELLLVAHRLLREDEDCVAVERRLDLGEDAGHDRTGEIDTPQLGAKTRMKWLHCNRHLAALGDRPPRYMIHDGNSINSTAKPARSVGHQFRSLPNEPETR